jgi:hypothetical protein
MPAMLGEILAPQSGHGDECSDSVLMMTRYEAPLVGILPDRKSGTRGAPCGHDVSVGLRLRSDPCEKIEYQGFDGIRQLGLQLYG